MNSKSVMIKPKRGLKVFNPATKLHLKESGEEIVMSTYWKRRFKDDEIEMVEQAKPVKKTKTKKTKNIQEVE